MAEIIKNEYKALFEIRLLHHYWLDDGATVYDLIAEPGKRDGHLLSYDMRSFLMIEPTAALGKILKGLGCVYKNTALGCVVAAPKNAEVPKDINFEFIVTVRDPAFYNYTALTLRKQQIHELYHQPEDRTYRYKENVPVLTNLAGTSRGTQLFLSSEIPSLAPADQVESLGLSGAALMQLTGEQPGATQQLNAQATNLPVFVHQGDVPVIVPPSGLVGAPERGIMLSDDIPDTVFALIRLTAIRDDVPFSFVDNAGKAKATCPIFQVRFKNRSTFWKYFNKTTGDWKSTTPQPLPITYHGNAAPVPEIPSEKRKQKPSGSLVKAEKDNDNKIVQLVSEIFE
jgi:hypothetical protein